MKKILFLLIFVLFSYYTRAQNSVFNKNIKLKSGLSIDKSTYPIIDEENEQMLLSIRDSEGLHSILLDFDFNELKTIISERIKPKYELLTYNNTNGKYHLFFADDKKKDFLIRSIDVTTGGYEDAVFKTNKKEVFLESFKAGKTLYFMTMIANTSLMNFYKFEENKVMEKQTIDLSTSYPSGEIPSLHFDLLNWGKSLFGFESLLYQVDESLTVPVYLTKMRQKLFIRGNELIISIDNQLFKTRIIEIDLNDFSHKVRDLPQVKTLCDINSINVSSNSFLKGDQLYQILSCTNHISFQIVDFKSGEIVQTFTGDVENGITFNSTPVYTKSAAVDYHSSMGTVEEKPKKILKKLAKHNPSISVMHTKEGEVITIGSTILNLPSTYNYMPASGIDGTLMVMRQNDFPIPVFNSLYHYYQLDKYSFDTAIFQTVIDGNGERKESLDYQQNIYEHLAQFEIKNELENKKARTMFAIGNDYYWGFYEKGKKNYSIVKVGD